MIIVNLKGGLGNQMFQYALAHVLAVRNGSRVACDRRFLDEYNQRRPIGYMPRDLELGGFGIPVEPPDSRSLTRTMMFPSSYAVRAKIGAVLDRLGYCTIFERDRVYEARVLERRERTLYLDGHWQSERYFAECRNAIRELFTRHTPRFESPAHAALEFDPDRSVCIHVRRGDFIGSREHDCLPPAYYETAVRLAAERSQEALRPYVFSDDIEWCRVHLPFLRDAVFVTPSNPVVDLHRMRTFRHFVIPNSSFAWWSAWLSDAPGKLVIAPRRWSGTLPPEAVDIVPPEWLTI